MEKNEEKEILNYFGKALLEKLPVNYRLMQSTGGEKRYIKVVESNFYQTKVILTHSFYKPISKPPILSDAQDPESIF